MNKRILILSLLLIGCTADQEEYAPDQSSEQKEAAGQDTIQSKDAGASELQQKDLKILLEQLRKGEVKFDFYAVFTEPFWTIYFIGDDVVFDHAWEEPEFYRLDRPFDPNKSKQSLKFSNANKEWEILIKKGEGSDGMSEITYPYITILNDEMYGGGGQELCRETFEEPIALDELAFLHEGTYTYHDSHRTSLLKIKKVRDHEFDFYMETGTEEGCTGRIEGVGELYDDGSARFTTADCKAIYFQFVANGISVKELDCDDFHGARCSFDGFYD